METLRVNGLVILNLVLKSRINMRIFSPTELDITNKCVLDVTKFAAGNFFHFQKY